MKPPQQISLALHITLLVLLLLIPITTSTTAVVFVEHHSPLLLPPIRLRTVEGGGGGGGPQASAPASQGSLPKPAPRPLLPPQLRAPETSVLMIEPTLDLPQPDPALMKFANYGSPWASPGPPTPGNGKGGGLGDGEGGAAGPGVGNKGIGPDSGRNVGGGSKCAQSVSPVLLYKVEPEFTEEARKARVQGAVMIKAIINESGVVQQPQVTRSLGLGLDERALEAVEKWRFKAGMKNCRPAAMSAWIEVHFHLL